MSLKLNSPLRCAIPALFMSKGRIVKDAKTWISIDEQIDQLAKNKGLGCVSEDVICMHHGKGGAAVAWGGGAPMKRGELLLEARSSWLMLEVGCSGMRRAVRQPHAVADSARCHKRARGGLEQAWTLCAALAA